MGTCSGHKGIMTLTTSGYVSLRRHLIVLILLSPASLSCVCAHTRSPGWDFLSLQQTLQNYENSEVTYWVSRQECVLCPLLIVLIGACFQSFWDTENQGHFAPQALRTLLESKKDMDGHVKLNSEIQQSSNFVPLFRYKRGKVAQKV